MYKALKCPCRSPNCEAWHISEVAELQGVNFSHKQAFAVANLLNLMREPDSTQDFRWAIRNAIFDAINEGDGEVHGHRIISELAEAGYKIVPIHHEMTIGVGTGDGKLFVHGDYDSIKAVQALIFELEDLRRKVK